MDSIRKKNKKPVHIGRVVDQLLKICRQDLDDDFIKIWSLWDEIVGEVVSQNARPSGFKGNCLYVHVTSSPWLHQLQFLKNDIIDKLNAALNKNLIGDIKFKIGG